MTFGKYADRELADIPDPYLIHVLGFADLDPVLREGIRLRLGLPSAPTGGAGVKVLRPEVQETVLRRWKRRMAVDYPEEVVAVGEGVLKSVLEGLR